VSFLKKAALVFTLISLVTMCLGCSSKALEQENEALKQQNAELTGAKQQLESTLQTAQSDLAAAQQESTKTKADLAALQTNYDKAVTEKDSAVQDLGEMEAVFPPREFESVTELRNWLLDNDISERPDTETASLWYAVAVELQKAALNDGYIISVDYDSNEARDTWWVWCTTVINGNIWYWDPEEDDVYEEEDLGPVE
jgi:hypothetical protein